MKTRFAPSPTGYLHLGHALAAKQAFEYAQAHEGECWLRIEDIDHTRCKPEFTEAIFEDLAWLGFDWSRPARIQSEHMADDKNAVAQLNERGLVYRCFKTRTQLSDAPPAPLPPDEEKTLLQAGKAYAWRLSIRAAQTALGDRPLSYEDTGTVKTVTLSTLDDIVLARKDIGTSYHIAVTHDDAMQGMTHIVRGADFIDQTPYHVLLQNLMGWPVPIYHHHALLRRADGEKLSKRNQDTAIRSLREKGLTAAQVLAMVVA